MIATAHSNGFLLFTYFSKALVLHLCAYANFSSVLMDLKAERKFPLGLSVELVV